MSHRGVQLEVPRTLGQQGAPQGVLVHVFASKALKVSQLHGRNPETTMPVFINNLKYLIMLMLPAHRKEKGILEIARNVIIFIKVIPNYMI